jgi:hypothetical protein
MPPKKPYLIAAGLWLAMVAVFFAPVLFQGKVLAPLDIMDSLLRPWATAEEIEVHNAFTYDAISQYLPYDYSVYQSLRQDGYIGWSPYTHSGTSIVQNTMLCPGDWHHHLYRFLPFWTAWNTSIILQFTLAGLGMLLLLRDRRIPPPYALLGVVAFGFYSQFILWIYHGWVLGAMCWAPWILWALFRAKRSGRIVDPASVIFIALAFRGGHLQACVFVVLLVLMVAITDWWKTEERWEPKRIWNSFLPYAVAGILGSILALDVFVETVPALLQGNKQMTDRSWVSVLLGLPTLVTSIFPTIMGTPQGLDTTKMFASDLFSIKFMGAVPLILAAFACFRRQAPAVAKVLLILGLVLPFTPADKWLYSRFTAVFALGGAWLAAWYLMTISKEAPSKVWKRAMIILAVIVGVWLLGSAVVVAKQPWIQSQLHEMIMANLPVGKPTRTDWMLSRADVFIADSLVWAPRNLATLALIALGLFACSRVHSKSPNAPRFALLVAFCAFGELFLFSSTWVTFSGKPSGNGLYDEPQWVQVLKRNAGDGTVLCYANSDFDYMQLNTPSAYGIRFAGGYETVTPHRISPNPGNRLDPDRCAAAGISLLLAPPDKDPGTIPGWEKVVDSEAFHLYWNPAFKGICFAEHRDGTTSPLPLEFTSANRRKIQLPPGTGSVTVLESFKPGWKYSLNGAPWRKVGESTINGMRIDFETAPQGNESELILQYRPAYQKFYRPVIGTTLAGLLGLSLIRASRERLRPVLR